MDLPLSSNYKDIQVFHWILDLACDFSKKQLSGSQFLFCQSKNFCEGLQSESKEHVNQNSFFQYDNINHKCSSTSTEFQKSNGSFNKDFILDCQDLHIEACYFYSLEEHSLDLVSSLHHSPVSDNHREAEKDCSKVNEKTSLKVHAGLVDNYLNIYNKLEKDKNKRPLRFVAEKTCLRMTIPHSFFLNGQAQEFFAVQIIYKTCGKGASLTWTVDQDMQPCVYTSGHLLNNRTLMPCQDMPQAMSTWHCFTSVPPYNAGYVELDKVTVLMAGEAEPNIRIDQDGGRTFCYQSSYPMPASTFALAIGTWPEYLTLESSDSTLEKENQLSLDPSVRIFASSKFHGKALKSLTTYLPSCFSALGLVLGKYPLHKLDILIVPSSFDSLGMMCPHLLFLSQSILVEESKEAEGGMFYRVAHELCHTWLGILIGPCDWTEEWLTEGICCYLEDIVHATACKWSETVAKERLELRCLIKFRVLKAEISTTSEGLQTLRPNADAQETNPTWSTSSNDEPLVVKNGLNPEKTLLQVHYLKGFFLLKHLEQQSGKEKFLQVLRDFISSNLGQLFSSMDLLEFCFKHLTKLRQSDLTVSSVCQEWLDRPGMPQALSGFAIDGGNALFTEVKNQLSSLRMGACRKRSKRRSDTTPEAAGGYCLETKCLLPEQRVLLLDLLVEEDVKLTRSQMTELRSFLRIQDATAEVQHSWCELVVLRKALHWLEDVERFLIEHQAMGVYLYGELMISRNARMQALARKVFRKLHSTMAESQRLAVKEMLYPT